ncbi:protein sidekick-1-like [Amphiura filiformis]|uniref:protein sidekick-1-like n=1 Tax=Amphiura filiformis TaxID=82378 RepID=UPI003B21B760
MHLVIAEPYTCPTGLFGDLCDLQCHCKNYNTCVKATGVCADYQCADGWGGNDCRQALPALYEMPDITIDGTSVTLRWNAWDASIDYGTGPAEKYQVYFAKQNQPLVPFSITMDTNERIDNLKGGTGYKFAISVFRHIDSTSTEGILSPEGSAHTKCVGPDAPPGDIEHSDGNIKEQLSFSWQPPSEDECNSDIILYEYQFDIYAEAESNEWPRNGSTSDTSVIFGHLPHYTEFQFRVRALTSVGTGPFSKFVTAWTLPSVPSAPRNLIVLRSYTEGIELTWMRPIDLNGELNAYVLTGTKNEDIITTIITPVYDETAIGNITGLQPGSKYGISVHGVTNGGEGPISNEVLAETLGKTDQNELNEDALIIGLSATICLLIIIMVALFCWKRRNISDQSNRKDTQIINDPSPPVALSPDGYVKYVPPQDDVSDGQYEDLDKPSAMNDADHAMRHIYTNAMGDMRDDEVQDKQDEHNYEAMPNTDGNDENVA